MKQLILINGPMGVGKSAASACLLKKAGPAVYLDGDWCWNIHPFCVNEENKAMVLRNIDFMLRSFLENSQLQRVIFCWVMPEKKILDSILKPLQDLSFSLYTITLLANEATLCRRLQKDVEAGIRDAGCIQRSLSYLTGYEDMDTCKIYTDAMTPEETSEAILQIIKGKREKVACESVQRQL